MTPVPKHQEVHALPVIETDDALLPATSGSSIRWTAVMGDVGDVKQTASRSCIPVGVLPEFNYLQLASSSSPQAQRLLLFWRRYDHGDARP